MTKVQAQALYDNLVARGFDESYETGTGRTRAIRVKCSQCSALAINGHACHESGCPNQTHECRECGAPTRNRWECDDCIDQMVISAEIKAESGPVRRY